MPVARIERSEIRDGGAIRVAKSTPDFTSFNPGYSFVLNIRRNSV
jgi:hypothetical protein